MNLLEFFEKVYRVYHPKLRSDQAIATMRQQIKCFVVYLAEHEIKADTDALTEDHLVQFSSHYVEQGFSPATCNSVLRAVRSIWIEAQKRGYTSTRHEVHLLKEPERLPEAWFPQDMEKILRSAAKEKNEIGQVDAGIWWTALILVVYWTGARISAAMHIRSCDVDLESGTIRLPFDYQKTYRDELRDIPEEVCELLKRFNKDRNEFLFGDWPNDNWQNRTIKKGFEQLGVHYHRILTRAGLPATPRDKWHKLRRTFGTRVAAAAGRAIAQELLGHRHMQTTERYLDPRQIPRHQATKIIDGPAINPELLENGQGAEK
tara:strand:- start:47421 stop:48374 length:954 start_codon:yes stop_codon:yes gene_type:complete